MKAEQLKELLQDEDFANKLKTLHTPEEIMAAFQEKGVDVTAEELIKPCKSDNAELTDEELENVAGGYSWDEFWDDVQTALMIWAENSMY